MNDDDDRELRARQAGSFGAAAAQYERGRPGYPEAALDWLLPAQANRVLDLGAGTGKLTRQLVDRGLDVVAVEPSEGMRAQFAGVLPQVPVLDGTAEAIPLPDHSVDTVLVAQAWHWVDVPRAVPEVARVLVPGGCLGLIWNTRDERVAWLAQLGELMDGGVRHMDSANPVIGAPFGPIERHDVEWSNEVTPATLIDMVSSRSYIITSAPAEREARLDRVRDLLAHHPELAGRDSFALPYVTRCARAFA
jgi:SAM-dependent methyltransferase